MKVYDILKLVPDCDACVRLCFLCEDKTWVDTYAGHPILVPFYDCEVIEIGVDDGYLQIWIESKDFYPTREDLRDES